MDTHRILVIDDEVDFLGLVKTNLESTGKYEVITLNEAKEIVSKVNLLRPDIILLDILMHGVDGLKACDELNKDPIGRGIPIIIMSALARDRDKLNAYKLGVVDYIIKPVQKNELISRIEKALSYKHEKPS